MWWVFLMKDKAPHGLSASWLCRFCVVCMMVAVVLRRDWAVSLPAGRSWDRAQESCSIPVVRR